MFTSVTFDMGRSIRIVLFALFIVIVISLALIAGSALNLAPKPNPSNFAAAAIVSSPFVYTFNAPGTLYEAGSMDESTSPYWWVNSGGKLEIKNGVGQTVQNELGSLDRFRLLYAAMNPLDTDDGAHPQNTFRLLTRSTWDNVRVTSQFQIMKDNLTDSPNRNASNGLILMSRYRSSDTLYYAGIRVDGAAVIKKKYNGTYYTLGYKKLFGGTYHVDSNPNLLPQNEWIDLRMDTVTNWNGTVTVRLFMQRDGGTWIKILESTDDGKAYGGTPPITGKAFIGIRTDFMDVQFDTFRADKI